MKQPLFALPVSHLHLFGTDFDSSAEIATKNQSAFQKVLYIPKKKVFQSPIVPQQHSGRRDAAYSHPGPSSTRTERVQSHASPASSRSSASSSAWSSGRAERPHSSQDPPPRQPFRGSRGRGRYPRRSRGGRWSY